MIVVENVSKRFGDRPVLKNVSFTVPDGQTCALLGLSGSGKTTLLKLICGLFPLDSGHISVQGVSLEAENLMNVRSQLGYVIQDGGLFPHLSARENLWLIGQEAGQTSEQISRRISELCQLTNFSEDILDHYPRQLSGGQKQRVGLMRALFKNPPVLLLDEPLGALDPITRSDLQTELRDLCRKLKKTVLLVTHDIFEAGYLATRILLLNQGEVLQDGSLNDLIKQPANEFVSRFVTSQINRLDSP